MSKKLIAVAAAAALALTGLVAVPAQAAGFQVAVADSGSSANTTSDVKSTPAKHAAPEKNALVFTAEGTADAATNTVVRYTVSGASTTDVAVGVVASGGVKLTTEVNDADGNALKIASGVDSLTGAYKTSVSYVFYAFTTSTTAGSIAITAGGNTQVYYLASKVGTAYNVDATFPTFIGSGSTGTVTAKFTDVFGNQITGTNRSDVTALGEGADAFTLTDADLTVIGATVADGQAWVYVAANSRWEFADVDDITVASGSTGNIAARIDLTVTDQKVGFAAPRNVAFANINSGDLTAAVAALNTQIAALQVIVDRKVTKKRYNTLARKWNRAFPSQKVWVKP
jgi:hypothetical protein